MACSRDFHVVPVEERDDERGFSAITFTRGCLGGTISVALAVAGLTATLLNHKASARAFLSPTGQAVDALENHSLAGVDALNLVQAPSFNLHKKHAFCRNKYHAVSVGHFNVDKCAAAVLRDVKCGVWFNYGSDGTCNCVPIDDGDCREPARIQDHAQYSVYYFEVSVVGEHAELKKMPLGDGVWNCKPGEFKDGESPSGCSDCPAGQFSNQWGSPYCTGCEPGKYNEAARSTACESCSAGRFSVYMQAEHCTPCAEGAFSSSAGSTHCQACPSGTWTNGTGVANCRVCDVVFGFLQATSTELPKDLAGKLEPDCRSPLIHMATPEFKPPAGHTRIELANALLAYGLDFNMRSPESERTPIVAVVDSCRMKEEQQDRLDLLKLLVAQAADTVAQSPLEQAITKRCPENWIDALRPQQHSRKNTTEWQESWDQKVTVFGFGPVRTLWLSPLLAVLGGLLAGCLCRKVLAPEADAHRGLEVGAVHLAARALGSSSSHTMVAIMCFLAAVANIAFPMLVCMILVSPQLWLPMYCILVCVPAWVLSKEASGCRFLHFAKTALPFRYEKRGVVQCFHLFSAVRTLCLLPLAILVSKPEKQTMVELAAAAVPWPWSKWYQAMLWLSDLMPHEGWLTNDSATVFRSPWDLPVWQGLFPTRGIFYAFQASIGILSLLWCALTLCVVFLVVGKMFARSIFSKVSEVIDPANLLSGSVAVRDTQGFSLLGVDASQELETPIVCKSRRMETLARDISRRDGSQLHLLPGMEVEVSDAWTPYLTLRERWTPEFLASPSIRRHVCFRSEFGGGGMAVIVREVREVIKATIGKQKEAKVLVTDDNCCEVVVPSGVLSVDIIKALTSGASPYIRIREGPTILEIKHVQALGVWSLLPDIGLLFLHLVADLLQIYSLFMSGNHFSAGLLLFTRTALLVAQRMNGIACNVLHEEFAFVRKRGYKSNEFFRMKDGDQGFQGFVSLAICSYSLWFQVSGWWTCAAGLFNMMVSACAVAAYLFRNTFMSVSTWRWCNMDDRDTILGDVRSSSGSGSSSTPSTLPSLLSPTVLPSVSPSVSSGTKSSATTPSKKSWFRK